MSVQFGKWNFMGEHLSPDYLEQVSARLARYGPDSTNAHVAGGIGMIHCAFHTTWESRREVEPHISSSGAVILWDGRLDNRVELIRQVGNHLAIDSSDVEIVSAAHERWGTDCFAKLIGDWALSIWKPDARLLVLAKDFLGSRHLYYSLSDDHVTWSTVLDPLVLLAGTSFRLSEEYIAGWLHRFPAAHLTPYASIQSVPPSSYVHIEPRKAAVRRYWNFDSAKQIVYRNDLEYEENFRAKFAESISRRLLADQPILAELSGGMDSSSIVCMADHITASGIAPPSRLDTVSYYDNSEPNWNERPYFAKVEEKRGRIGCHIAINSGRSLIPDFECSRFAPTPSVTRHSETTRQLGEFMRSNGHRILLSGVGGDEVMGGVPTAAPELSDLLASGRFGDLGHQLKAWALNNRQPWFHLFFESIRSFLPMFLCPMPKHRKPAPWLRPGFVRRNRAAFDGYESRLRLNGPSPSFQENLNALETLRRQLGDSALPFDPPYEKRYPFLDRDLLEFLYAIPREQLIRPGCRRSLMRRALAGTVPNAVLERRRKAFVSRSPLLALSSSVSDLQEISRHMLTEDFGIVDSQKFSETLLRARRGMEVSIVSIVRTLRVEFWLRHIRDRGILREVSAQHVARFSRKPQRSLSEARR